jgi:DNA-binding MarR family transcriptional regulator
MAEREISDLATLQAFTHPLRLRMLTLLRLDGPLTASELARRTNESSGATSYHLRQLERFGFVQDAAEPKTGRQRRWMVTSDSQRVRGTDFAADPAAWALVGELAGLNLQRWADALRGLVADPERWADWLPGVLTSYSAVRMSPDELTSMTAEMQALIGRYEQQAPVGPEGRETVVVYFGAAPTADPT